MRVLLERDCSVHVTEYLAQRFHVEAAFQRACRECVARRVEPNIFNLCDVEQPFEVVLYIARLNRITIVGQNEIAVTAVFVALQQSN
jgi:Tfp pilus assembly ATPase PilU